MNNLESESIKLTTKEDLNEIKRQRYYKDIEKRVFIDNYNKMYMEKSINRKLENVKEPKEKKSNIFSYFRLC